MVDFIHYLFSPQTFDGSGEEVIVNDGVGGEPIKQAVTHYASQSTGEMPINIKQFLSRYQQIQIFSSPGTLTNSMRIYPWMNSRLKLGTVALEGPNYGVDAFSLFSPCYAFMSGSIKLTVVGVSNVTMATVLPNTIPLTPAIAQGTSDGSGSYESWITNNRSGLHGTAINQFNLGYCSVHVPYYAKTRMSIVLSQQSMGNVQYDKSSPYNWVHLYSNSSMNNPVLLRSCGDDFKFHFFVGCPPIYRPT